MKIIIAGLLSTLCLLAACDAPEQKLSYAGATTHVPVINEAARLYELRHPDVRVEVSGGGSTIGWKSVIDGTADLGGMARDLTEKESASIMRVRFAHDAIAVVVHEDTDIDATTIGELKTIFSGINAPNGLTRVAKSWAHGTAQAFAGGIGLAMQDVRAEAEAGSNGKVLATVAAVPNSLGYVSVSDAELAIRNGAPVRILSVDGVMPSLASLEDGTYPLSRTLWLVLPLPKPGRTVPNASDFVIFLTGPEVAQMLRDRDFLPAN